MTGRAFFTVVWGTELPHALALRESLARVEPAASCTIAVVDRPHAPRPDYPDLLTLEDIALDGPEWWLFTASPDGLLDLLPAFADAVRSGPGDLFYVAPSLAAWRPLPEAPPTTSHQSNSGRPLLIQFREGGQPPMALVTERQGGSRGALVCVPAELTGSSNPAFIDFASHGPNVASWVAREGLGLTARRALGDYNMALRRFAAAAGGAAQRLNEFENGVAIPTLARTLASGIAPDERARLGSPYRSGPGSFYEALSAGDDRIPVARRLWMAAWASRPDLPKAFPDPCDADRERFLEWCATSGRAEHGVHGRLAPTLPRMPSDRPEGLNVIGFLSSDAGLGTAARGLADAVARAGGKVARLPIKHPEASAPGMPVAPHPVTAPYSINVVVTSGSSTVEVMQGLAKQLTPGQQRVAYWMWETDRLPDTWADAADCYDEIWAVSTYVADTVFRATGIKPLVIPHAVERRVAQGAPLDRADLGIAPDAVVFLFMFDYLSRIERKNPLGVIEAFRRAFGHDERAALVIKSSRARLEEDARARLEAAAGRMPNVRLVDGVFTTTHRLYELADCYVSLHRSEGFGLTMAEAMAAGKPVIATGYSGNLDFMPADSAHLVPYELSEIPEGCHPYPAGDHWAEPDLDAAAEYMRTVFEDRPAARALGERGRAAVLDVLNPVKIGSAVLERIRILSSTP